MRVGDVELLGRFANHYAALRDEIHEVVIGQKKVVDELLIALFSQAHVLLVGVPGLAKTLLAKTLAGVLGWDFKHIQFTPDMMPSDITGTDILQMDAETGRRFICNRALWRKELIRTDRNTSNQYGVERRCGMLADVGVLLVEPKGDLR